MFFLVWLNNNNNNSFNLSIIYRHSNSQSSYGSWYGMAISLIIAVARATLCISEATAAGNIEDKATPEDLTGLKIANWGLVGHS